MKAKLPVVLLIHMQWFPSVLLRRKGGNKTFTELHPPSFKDFFQTCQENISYYESLSYEKHQNIFNFFDRKDFQRLPSRQFRRSNSEARQMPSKIPDMLHNDLKEDNVTKRTWFWRNCTICRNSTTRMMQLNCISG